MVHGDDKGLRLPPRIAPIQVVVVPIWRKDEDRARIEPYVEAVERTLRDGGVRVRVDWRDQVTPGFKFNDWEMRGVPLRLEVGPRDVQSDTVVAVRRDTREKESVPVGDLDARATDLLADIQQGLLEQALRFRDEHTSEANSWEELSETLSGPGGFVWVNWCDSEECTRKLAGEKATVRAVPLEEPPALPDGPCVCCGRGASFRCVVARSY
jgi:prolyl-tRNA synthetase